MIPRVAYLVTYPRGAGDRDAVAQDVEALRLRVDARVYHLSPPEPLRRIFPERLFGLWLVPRLRRIEAQADVVHVLHGVLRDFPVLRLVRRPIVYSLMTGFRGQIPPDAAGLARRARITVSSSREAEALAGAGIPAAVLRPGIDLGRFRRLPPLAHGPGEPFTVLCGSAPWAEADFARKGIDSLLDAAASDPTLRLVFLWRGVLLGEMKARLAARGLQSRVRIVEGQADVAAELANAHAAALVASDPRVVKAYPHSLMEALACGRPVLLSPALPMADDVAALRVGVVAADARTGLSRLQEHYHRYANTAATAPREIWSRESWLAGVMAEYAARSGAGASDEAVENLTAAG